MGLFSKLFKKSASEVRSDEKVAAGEIGEGNNYMQANCSAIPVFEDFRTVFSIVCANPHGLDIQELVDKGFTLYADNGLVDVSNESAVQQLYWALNGLGCSDEFSVGRFDEPGYITRLVNEISAASKAADHPIEKMAAQNSMFSVCIMASKYYLEKYPEFNKIVPFIIQLFR